MKLNLLFHLKIAGLGANDFFFGDYCNFSPTIPSLLKNVFILPFFSRSIYVGPFWTIKYEFIGFILCSILSLFFLRWKWRRVAYMICFCVFGLYLDFNYCGFILGLLCADICFDNTQTVLSNYYSKKIKQKRFLFILSVMGIYLACCPKCYTGIYKWFNSINSVCENGLPTEMVRSIGVTLLVYVVINIEWMHKIFETSLLLFLGKISFSVYAFHWPIMMSIESWLFCRLMQKYTYVISSIASFLIVLPIIYLVGFFFWYFIEKKKIYREIYREFMLGVGRIVHLKK